MWRIGLGFLSLVFFAFSSARLCLGERQTTAVARAVKGDIQHSAEAAVSEPKASAGSEEHVIVRSAEAYAAFENIWTTLPPSEMSTVQEQISASLMQEAQSQWAFAPSAAMPEEARSKVAKALPDRTDNAPTRIYVLYGQYGWATSSGMYYLAQNLARYGEVSVHPWDDRTILLDAKRHSGKIVIIGYSLGANSTVAIANKLPQVDLIVAYDPSRLSPLAVDQRLHDITEEAVKQVALGSPAKEGPAPESANAFVASQPDKQASASGENSVSRTAARASMPNG